MQAEYNLHEPKKPKLPFCPHLNIARVFPSATTKIKMDQNIIDQLRQLGVAECELVKTYENLDKLADVIFELWLKDINNKPQA